MAPCRSPIAIFGWRRRFPSTSFHAAARTWLAERGPHEAHFCRSTQQSFLRLLTTKAVLAPYRTPPLSNKAAWSVYVGLRADARISWAEEPDGLEASWKKFSAAAHASPKLWMDAYLAAFAMAGGHQLVTTDKAFKQFKGLDVAVLSSKG
jgi:toxin-antitoxin system PIN domain toxin